MKPFIPTIAFALSLASPLLLGASARADDQAAQQACGNDVFALCQVDIPDRGKIAACLRQHYSKVSQPCRAYMANYGGEQQHATRQAAKSQSRHHRRETTGSR